jgi:hypothetical protein
MSNGRREIGAGLPGRTFKSECSLSKPSLTINFSLLTFTIGAAADLYFGETSKIDLFYFGLAAHGRWYPLSSGLDKLFIRVEMDEMWSFYHDKTHQIWLWRAIDHESGEVIAFWFQNITGSI